MIQITGGKLKGRRIDALEGKATRPTLSKIRASVFNVLNSRFYLDDFIWIDLFGGSGVMSFEALSRGCQEAILIENSSKAVQIIKKNIQQLQLQSQCNVYMQDSFSWMSASFHHQDRAIFYFDPPYQSSHASHFIEFFSNPENDLKENILVMETDQKVTLEYPSTINLFQSKTYGHTRIDFIQSATQQKD